MRLPVTARNRAVSGPVATGLAGACVGLIAVIVRLPDAFTFPLWGDEIASARALAQPELRDVLFQIRLKESTPPAWYTLAWLVHRAGVPLPDLRLISVLASGLVAGLTVAYARRLMPLPAAALSGLAVALGLQFVVYGRELRSYALLALLVVVFAIALEAATTAPAAHRLLLLGGCTAAGALTHYFFLLTVATGGLWVWSAPATRDARLRVSAALLAALVPFLVWLPSFREQFRWHHSNWIDHFDPLKVAYIHSAFFADVGLLYHRAATVSDLRWSGSARLGFLGLVVLASIALARSSPRGRLCALLANGPVVLAALGSLAGARIFDVRNLLVAAPFTAIVVAYSISRVRRRISVPIGAAAVALLVLSFLQARRLEPLPFRKVADALATEGWQPDDRIAVFASVSPFPRPTEYTVVPLGWYLPGHPRLSVTRPSVVNCRHIYVVAAEKAGRTFLLGSGEEEATTDVGRIVVARLPASPAIAIELASRGAHFLRARRHRECRIRRQLAPSRIAPRLRTQ